MRGIPFYLLNNENIGERRALRGKSSSGGSVYTTSTSIQAKEYVRDVVLFGCKPRPRTSSVPLSKSARVHDPPPGRATGATVTVVRDVFAFPLAVPSVVLRRTHASSVPPVLRSPRCLKLTASIEAFAGTKESKLNVCPRHKRSSFFVVVVNVATLSFSARTFDRFVQTPVTSAAAVGRTYPVVAT